MTLARFRPASVKRIESLTASAFKELSRDVQAVPLHLIRAAAPRPDLFKLLRSVKDRFVEVELGRYDQQFEKVSIPLSAYLDWLEDGNSTVQGKQMYLAQSNLITEVPELKEAFPAPAFFEESIKDKAVDLYQASLFLGPTGAVTPLHFDPTANLFELLASSGPEAVKHFLLFPPSLQLSGSRQRNTSDLDFSLHPTASGIEVSGEVQEGALACVLRKGEMLYVPNRWRHRVENVSLDGKGGWSAGLGWWHMKR